MDENHVSNGEIDSQTTSFQNMCKINEDNNNLLHRLKNGNFSNCNNCDSDDQQSNSSSLESRNSLTNHQGSHDGDLDEESGSTSCSEDSFEMSSTCSGKEEHSEAKNGAEGHQNCLRESSERSFSDASSQDPTYYDSETYMQSKNFKKIRDTVADQIEKLDTGLPKLDFGKIEQHLATAAKQREEMEKLMIQHDVSKDSLTRDFEKFKRRPHQKKTNPAIRLSSSKNLQVCFMNELSETETENGDDSECSEVEHSVRKSKSYPNFDNKKNEQSISKSVTEIQMRLKDNETVNSDEQCLILNNEVQRVMKMAEKKAESVLADYRRGKSMASDIPRQARQYLSKTKLPDIQNIHQKIEEAITRKNAELVRLLQERDNLHMEHDSLCLDIDDFTKQKSSRVLLDLKKLLQLQDELESSII